MFERVRGRRSHFVILLFFAALLAAPRRVHAEVQDASVDAARTTLRALDRSGDVARARATYEELVARSRDPALAPAVRAALQVELARLSLRIGDEQRGLDLARQAVEALTGASGPDALVLVPAQRVRSMLATALGSEAEAADAAEDALRITRLGKPVPVELAIDENGVAEALMKLGSYAEAERHLDEAARALEHTPRSTLAGIVWSNLGWVGLAVGYNEGARRMLERARTTLTGADPESHRALVRVYGRLGELARRTEALDDALRYDGLALSYAVAEYGPDHDEVGRALAAVGATVIEDGRPADAEPYLRRSIAVLTARLGPDNAALAQPHKLLAECLLFEGKPAEASAELVPAFQAENRRLEALVPRSRPDDIRRYLDATQETTYIGTSLALSPGATPDVVRQALGMVLTRKALDMDVERSRMRTLGASSDPKAHDLLARLHASRTALARALLQGVPGAEQINRLGNDESRLELEAARLAGVAPSAPSVREVDGSAVSRALPAGSALVELTMFKAVGYAAGQGGAYRVAAFVVRPDGTTTVKDLGAVEAVGARVGALRNAVQMRVAGPDVLAAAYSQIVQPWADAIDKVDTLFIAPDGPLTLLPFEILVRPDGKSLVETTRITYLTSGRELLGMGGAGALRRDLGPAVLLGDPDYDHAATPGASAGAEGSLLGGVHWPRLPGTEQEVRALAASLPGASVRVGDEVDTKALQSVGGERLVHLATHGFFLDSGGVLAAKSRGLSLDVGKQSMPERAELAAARVRVLESLSDRPEIRSGLVLAGANAAGSAGGGYLTASELASLDLSSADLVVLSACETAVGDTSAGLGVSGLNRSLGIAGARSEVVSLWKVDDAATAELMKQFYASLSAGMGRDQALQAAKLSVRAHAEWSAPYFWGAFQLFGDWRPIVAATNAAVALRVPVRAGCGACSAASAGDGGGAWALLVMGVLGFIALLRRRASRSLARTASAILVVSGGLAATHVADAAEPSADTTAADALAINERAVQKSIQGDYPQALALIERALHIEPDNDVFLASAGNLSGALGQPKKARAYYQQAIEAALEVGIKPRVQTYTRSLAQLAETENARLAAASVATASQTSVEATRGTMDVDALLANGDMGIQQGNPAMGLAAGTQAEAICLQMLPNDIVRLARSRVLEGLGTVGTGHPEGIKLLEQAVASLSSALGKDHPEVLTQRMALANALLSLGRTSEAVPLFESVVADESQKFGKDSAFTLMARSNLMDAYLRSDKPRQAIALGQQAIDPCRKQLGVFSPFCQQIAKDLAKAEYAAGNRAAAREAGMRALTDQLRATGLGGSNVLVPQHYAPLPQRPEVAELITLLANIDMGPGNHDTLQLIEAENRIVPRAMGRDSMTAMHVEFALAQAELQARKIDAGMKRLLDLHRRVDEAYGAYSPTAVELAIFASTTLASVNRFRDIEGLVVDTSHRVREVYGPTNETAIAARFNEGFTKVQLGRADGAAIMKEAAGQAAASLGPTNPLTVRLQQVVAATTPK